MKVVASMPMVKRCPFHPELDVGTVTLTWDRVAPDLHHVADSVIRFTDQAISHEDATQHLADEWECEVVTTWHTGGVDVAVSCSERVR